LDSKAKYFISLSAAATFAAALSLPGPGKSIINPGISDITTSEMSLSKVSRGSGNERSRVMRTTEAVQSKYAASICGWFRIANVRKLSRLALVWSVGNGGR